MNTSELNASSINSDGVVPSINIALGEVSVTLSLLMYEHDSSGMSGSATMSTSASGNLARLVLLGSSNSGLVFSENAVLGKDMTAPIGSGTVSITFSTAADMHRVVMLGEVAAAMNFAVAGSAYVRSLMSGNSSINFATSGALMQYIKRALPPAVTGIAFDSQADLTRYISLGQLQEEITFDVHGLLATLIFISGGSGITFDVDGVLFNNPAGPDLDGYTMIRPYVDRTMVRES